MNPPSHVIRLSCLLALVFLSSQVLIPVYAAATYTMTLETDSSSYSGSQPIKITGVISPAPGQGTGVIITVTNSAGSIADINEVFPSPTNGSFTDISVPGGNAEWTSGTFSVNATWGGNGATASQVVTFLYSSVATSTTTSTTSTTTTSTTTTSTTTTSTTSTTSTTTSTTTTAISTTTTTSTTESTTVVSTSTTPEFPSSVLAMVALLGLALVAVLSRRTSLRAPGNMGG